MENVLLKQIFFTISFDEKQKGTIKSHLKGGEKKRLQLKESRNFFFKKKLLKFHKFFFQNSFLWHQMRVAKIHE